MTIPVPMTVVVGALSVMLVPAWIEAMVAPAGTFVPVTGIPTKSPVTLPV